MLGFHAGLEFAGDATVVDEAELAAAIAELGTATEAVVVLYEVRFQAGQEEFHEPQDVFEDEEFHDGHVMLYDVAL